MNFKGLIARGPPQEPFFLNILRIAVLVLTVIILGLSSWGLRMVKEPRSFQKRQIDFTKLGLPDLGNFQIPDESAFRTKDESEGPFIFVIIMMVWTLLQTVAIGVIHNLVPQFYFRIGVFITYIVHDILILSAWAYVADAASDWGKIEGSEYFKKLRSAAGASAGLGALLWILLIVITVFWTLSALKSEGTAPAGHPTPATQLESVPVKQEAGYGQQPYGQQPGVAPQYAPQPDGSYPQQPPQGYPQQAQPGYPQ